MIIVDPHARHTTTNFRNASRYIIRYGLTLCKPALMVTSVNQADYIMDPRFDERNLKELKYLPYENKTRVKQHEIVFYPGGITAPRSYRSAGSLTITFP